MCNIFWSNQLKRGYLSQAPPQSPSVEGTPQLPENLLSSLHTHDLVPFSLCMHWTEVPRVVYGAVLPFVNYHGWLFTGAAGSLTPHFSLKIFLALSYSFWLEVPHNSPPFTFRLPFTCFIPISLVLSCLSRSRVPWILKLRPFLSLLSPLGIWCS